MSRIFSARNIIWTLVILALIIGSALLFPVALPAISLAPEQIGHLTFFGQPFTNTGLATLVADATVLIIGFLAVRKRSLVPSGIQNWVEGILELFLNQAQDLVGPAHARRMIPIAMTVFSLILAANWWGRVPGFEAIGVIEQPHVGGLPLWQTQRLLPGVYTVTANQVGVSKGTPATEGAAPEGAAATEGHGVPEAGILVPYLRGATTDLNFPIALALIAFIYIQYNGFKVNGLGYLKKFFNFTGFIPIFVGILELVSEFAKIISFSFRLFGNIFAGEVVLGVMAFLFAYLLPLPFYGLEIFVAFMQAFIFSVLTLVFMSLATLAHGGHDEHGHPETMPFEAADLPGHGGSH